MPDFSEVYQAYHGKVLSYAASLIGRDGADDVAQEVFVKIGRSLETLSDPSKLTSWVYAITLNTVRDAARMRSSEAARSPGGSGATPERGEAGDPLSRIRDDTARTPEETAIRKEMVACYLDYVNELPRDYYDVYVLREFENLPNEEIAKHLALPLSTVKMRLHRARARLHDELRRNCKCYYNERGELMGEPRTR